LSFINFEVCTANLGFGTLANFMQGHSRIVIDNSSSVREIVSTELPTIMTKLQNWWITWDEIHNSKSWPTHVKIPEETLSNTEQKTTASTLALFNEAV
jgi:hypothetical protein